MKFTKMQGIGNDYVYVDCFKEQVKNPAETAVKLSDRHFGVGSDGLILIKPSKAADFEMEMYNADGSRGEMCGNGIRCVAKYVYDKRGQSVPGKSEYGKTGASPGKDTCFGGGQGMCGYAFRGKGKHVPGDLRIYGESPLCHFFGGGCEEPGPACHRAGF